MPERSHPERSTRIRFMNPHAQSKDPSTPTLSQPLQGVLPHLHQPSPLREVGVNRVGIHLVYILSYTSCHPERSMRIRLMNPHAQSKDPCTPTPTSAASGSSPTSPPSLATKRARSKPCLHTSRIHRCHPERSMRIRFMNPHAQSKAPCTPTLSQPLQGVLPHLRQAPPPRALGESQ